MNFSPKAHILQQKLSFALLMLLGVLCWSGYSILNAVVAPAFEKLELNVAQTNMVRVGRAMDAELDRLVLFGRDWAPWDDAYLFVQGKHATFEQANLPVGTLSDLELDLLLYYNVDGVLYWGDLRFDGKPLEVSRSGVFDSDTPLEEQLTRHQHVKDEFRGLIRTSLGPMLIASLPIVHSDDSGPIGGTLITGRFFDAKMLAGLRQTTEVDFSWHDVGDGQGVPQSNLDVLLRARPDTMNHAITAQSIHSFFPRRGLNGEPILLLQVNTPRHISALADQTLSGALVLLAVATLVATLVISTLLRILIVKPLETVATHISSIHKSGDLSRRIAMNRNDEIGTVANNFDVMAGELDDARRQLVDQSFKAGKADTAAEVMHNIRNAMTPLINGIDRVSTTFDVTKGLKVGQATQELLAPECKSGRSEKLLQYIESAFKHVENTHDDARREILAVSKQAKLVEDILCEQEKYAHSAPVIESLRLDDMLDEAVLVVPRTSSPSVRIDLQEKLANFRIRGHRVGLLQVLGNIILNAYESIQRSQSVSGCISLSASSETIDEQEMIRLVVRDTGCGFAAEDKSKIFQRGYSSKSSNSSGLGLHWCANALATMGARIQAESTGDGQGAEFHVLLLAAPGG